MEGDLWKMESKLDFREGKLLNCGGLDVDVLKSEEVLWPLGHGTEKRGMFFVKDGLRRKGM